MKTILCFATALCGLTVSLSGQILYDFNSPGQLESEFYPTSFSAGTVGNRGIGTQAASGGLNDSGWVASNLNDGTRGYMVTEQTFSAATEAFTLSIYFKWENGTLSSGEALMLGIGRSTDANVPFTPVGGNSDPLGPESGQLLQVGIGHRTSDPNVIRPYGSTVIDGVNNNVIQPSSPLVTLAQGSWYYMQVDFSLLESANGWAVELGLFQSNDMGVVGNSLLSYEREVVNANLVSGDLHAFVGANSSSSTGGIAGVDDFYVSSIPEPTTYALLFAASCLGLVWLRKRNSVQK